MKKRILLLCILTILFSTGMEGCPDLDPMNYVVFTVNAIVDLEAMNEDCSTSVYRSADNVEILIEIVKAGGERCSEIVTTDITGEARLQCTHNVYKEQPVTISASVVGPAGLVKPCGGCQGYTYEWEFIYRRCGEKFGTSCAVDHITFCSAHIYEQEMNE